MEDGKEISPDELLGDNSFYHHVAFLESSPKFNEIG